MIRILSRLILVLLSALPSGALAAGNNWMTSLDGTRRLSQYSIPGTHDSGARFEPIPGTAKTQTLTITGQLEAGIRFLDMRCRHQDDAFNIYHGIVNQKLTFTSVLDDIIAFLNANPGETVIMSVKEEEASAGTTRSFEATFDSYIARNPSKWLLGPDVPTLDAARGKIVLFRRFKTAATPKGIDASRFANNTTFSIGGKLRVQDRYVVPDNDAKWAAILTLLEEARHGAPSTLYVNFASGYKSGTFGIPSITTVSNDINPRLATFFTANPTGRFGTILLDFADAPKAALIYHTNSP